MCQDKDFYTKENEYYAALLSLVKELLAAYKTFKDRMANPAPFPQSYSSGYGEPVSQSFSGYNDPLQQATFGNDNPLQQTTFGNDNPLQQTTFGYDEPLQQATFGYSGSEQQGFSGNALTEEYDAQIRRISEKRRQMQKCAANSLNTSVFIAPEYVREKFALDDFLSHAYTLALASELDTAIGTQYSTFPENQNKTYPSLDFCIRTYSARAASRTDLLKSWFRQWENTADLIFEDDEFSRFPLYRTLYLRRSIVKYLFHPDELCGEWKDLFRVVSPSMAGSVPLLIHEQYIQEMHRIRENFARQIFFLYGPGGSGRKTLAARYLFQQNRSCLYIEAAKLENPGTLQEVICAAGILNCGICIWDADSLWEKAIPLTEKLQKLMVAGETIFLVAENPYPGEKSLLPASPAEIKVPLPDPAEREILWKAALEPYGLLSASTDQGSSSKGSDSQPDPTALALRFSFTPGQIAEAAREIFLLSLQDGYQETDVYKACFRQISHQLGKKAIRIEPKYTWEDLILPELSKKKLQDACNQIRYQHMIYETWGFQEKVAYGRGVSMLFCGAPGTGKTMAAQVIANTLHMELYKVELSSVMNKYIGESQKALNNIFEEMKKSQSILFFDEADALFAKRSEVKDSNDRYANAETAYLLQKMEEYDGIVILATNYIQNFDVAFKRRIKLIIEFALPSEQERYQIWKKIFPAEAPLEEIPDYRFLAHTFALSGSSIKNIALNAAFRAAAESRGIRMTDVLRAVKEDLQKAGKNVKNSEFGEYAGIL